MMSLRLHIYTFSIFFISSVFFAIFLAPNSFGQSPDILPLETSIPASVQELMMNTPIFSTSEQSDVTVTPKFNDSTTNLAFYLSCPNPLCPDLGTETTPYYQFNAENIGRGDLSFSDYWAPPLPADYAVIEYTNDNQQFSCSGLTFETCLNDNRFVQVFYFTLVDESKLITAELRAEKALLNNPTPFSDTAEIGAVSEELRLLSIGLSSTSISSNLDNGLIVTASLDGLPTVALTSVSTSSLSSSTISDALLQLSINLSSTSIESNLDNGLVVTASLDGITNIATLPVTTTSPTSVETGTSDSVSTPNGAGLGGFLLDIVESVIDIFTPDTTSTSGSDTETQNEADPVDDSLPTSDTISETTETESAVQSNISTNEENNNEITSSTF